MSGFLGATGRDRPPSPLRNKGGKPVDMGNGLGEAGCTPKQQVGSQGWERRIRGGSSINRGRLFGHSSRAVDELGHLEHTGVLGGDNSVDGFAVKRMPRPPASAVCQKPRYGVERYC